VSPRANARELRGRRVVVIARRGRFAVARPLFEPGPQIGLAKGSADVKPGRMALA
jgi:hypothetical protein